MTPREALAHRLAPSGEYLSHTFHECQTCGWLRWLSSKVGEPEREPELSFEPIGEWEYRRGNGCERCLDVYARAPELVVWVVEVVGRLKARIVELESGLGLSDKGEA